MRFDEVEFQAVPLAVETEAVPEVVTRATEIAPWWRRLLALLTDLSLFAALALALSPLLPQPLTWMPVAALAGFTIVLSYYYFAGTWLLWGRTIGGAIFEVRRASITLRDASMRWFVGLVSVSATAAVATLIALMQ